MNVLQEANKIIFGDREATYGPPLVHFEIVAEFWRLFLERKHNVQIALLPDDVTTMMVLLKVARLMHTPSHRDTLVDIAGYAGLMDRMSTDTVMETPMPFEERIEAAPAPEEDTTIESVRIRVTQLGYGSNTDLGDNSGK